LTLLDAKSEIFASARTEIETENLSLEMEPKGSHISPDWNTEYKMSNQLKQIMSAEDLAHLGGGVFAYVRKIEASAAAKLIGNQMQVPADAQLFCLYNANGAPISISANYQAAIGSAHEHELIPASVH
jgi:hypothetical protein